MPGSGLPSTPLSPGPVGEMPSAVSIDIFHANDNHYVFGRRK
ncbi:hypothetical protein [Vitiosangium sp. GDMCC 1.1324]|nr:hypothetical protein [Vitiosangium sp. GDMCC 1.1324]